MHGRAVNLHSQAKPRLHRAILRWGGMAQLFFRKPTMISIGSRAIFSAGILFLLAGCRTVPVDGEAVECSRCETIWIRLYAGSPAPGIYRAAQREGRSPCSRCEQLSVQFFESGALRRTCRECAGQLRPRLVNVAR